jgi:hypothetical protein
MIFVLYHVEFYHQFQQLTEIVNIIFLCHVELLDIRYHLFNCYLIVKIVKLHNCRKSLYGYVASQLIMTI